MYQKRAFNRAEQELSKEMWTLLEAVEKRINEIGPCRERSLALTKLDEVLMWANAALAAGGIERLKTPVGTKPVLRPKEGSVDCAMTAGTGRTAAEPKSDLASSAAQDAGFGQAVDAMRYGIERYAPTREELIADNLKRNLDEAERQFGNYSQLMAAKFAMYRRMLGQLEKGGQNE